MSILVLGAGELGLAMLTALTSHPSRPKTASVHVLLRPSTLTSPSPSKTQTLAAIRSLGVSIVPGDVVHDPIGALAATFSLHDTVVSCTGFVGPAGTQRRICEAALQSSARRFVPWQFGVDYDAIGRGGPQPLFDEQLDVRGMLRAQRRRLRWVVVSTGLFMSFLFVRGFGVVDFAARTVRALGGWDVEVTLTGPGDIARVTAEVVFEPRGAFGGEEEGEIGGVVFVAGDTVSYRRVAELVEKRFPGVRFAREEWGTERLRGDLEGDEGDVWKRYRTVFGAGKGVAWPMEKTVNFERGIEMEDLEMCLERMETPEVLRG